MFHKNGPNMTEHVPMNFRWSSYDFPVIFLWFSRFSNCNLTIHAHMFVWEFGHDLFISIVPDMFLLLFWKSFLGMRKTKDFVALGISAKAPGTHHWGGSRYFEGVCFFCKPQRFKNLIVPKYQDSTPVKFSQEVSTLFQNYVWLNRITYGLDFDDFQISKTYIKIPPPKSLWKR